MSGNEVIKGPGSAVYGTNAFAGVINVVTYSAEELSGSHLHVSVGSQARAEVAVMTGAKIGENASVKAFARALDMCGDGLSTTPKGEPNIVRAIQSVNGGIEFNVHNTTLRYDFIDFTHTYW